MADLADRHRAGGDLVAAVSKPCKPYTPRVIDMVETRLKQGGWDGLYNADLECGCLVEDLAPCGDMQAECTAGHRILLSREDVESGAFGHHGEWFDGCWAIGWKREG